MPRNGTGKGMTLVTTIALCTSCSQAKNMLKVCFLDHMVKVRM